MRPPRRLQQLEEREEEAVCTAPAPPPFARLDASFDEQRMSTFEEQRAKSRSLDASYRGAAPSPEELQQLGDKRGGRRSEGESFLSRLFGSRRHKMRSSGCHETPPSPPAPAPRPPAREPPRMTCYQTPPGVLPCPSPPPDSPPHAHGEPHPLFVYRPCRRASLWMFKYDMKLVMTFSPAKHHHVTSISRVYA